MNSNIVQLTANTNCDSASAARGAVCDLRNTTLIPTGRTSQDDILISLNTMSGVPNFRDVRSAVNRLAIDNVLGVTEPAKVNLKAERQGDTIVIAPADTTTGTTGRLQVDRSGKVQEIPKSLAHAMAAINFYIQCGQRLLCPGVVPLSAAVNARN